MQQHDDIVLARYSTVVCGGSLIIERGCLWSPSCQCTVRLPLIGQTRSNFRREFSLFWVRPFLTEELQTHSTPHWRRPGGGALDGWLASTRVQSSSFSRARAPLPLLRLRPRLVRLVLAASRASRSCSRFTRLASRCSLHATTGEHKQAQASKRGCEVALHPCAALTWRQRTHRAAARCARVMRALCAESVCRVVTACRRSPRSRSELQASAQPQTQTATVHIVTVTLAPFPQPQPALFLSL